MALGTTNTNLTQIAVKRLSGKAMTNSNSTIPVEKYGSTVQTVASTVFAENLPNNPNNTASDLYLIQSASDGAPGTVMLVDFDVIPISDTIYENDIVSGETDTDVYSGDQGQTAVNTHHGYILKLTGSFEADLNAIGGTYFNDEASTGTSLGNSPFESGFTTSGSNKLQIVPEFVSTIVGTSNAYIPVISKTGSKNDFTSDPISPGAGIDYYLDPFAGILFVQDPVLYDGGAQNVPGKVRAFIYVGKYQDEVTFTSGDVNFKVSGSDDGFDVSNSDTINFVSGSAGITVESNNTSGTITIGESTDNITVNQITASIINADTIEVSEFIISSSVTYMTQSFSSGSTIFGDTNDDTHQFTGSISILHTGSTYGLSITGSGITLDTGDNISISASGYITASALYLHNEFTALDGGVTINTSTNPELNVAGNISSSGIISTSGELFAGIPEDTDASATKTVVYNVSTGQFEYTGSYGAADATELEASASAGIFLSASQGTGFSLGLMQSASFTSGSGTGLTVTAGNTNNIEFELVGVLSSSAQIATDISGAIDAATGSVLLDYGLLSSSAQIATDISGAINAATGSVLLDYGLLSSSAQIATEISGAIGAATASLSASIVGTDFEVEVTDGGTEGNIVIGLPDAVRISSSLQVGTTSDDPDAATITTTHTGDFNLINANATTINFGGAATTINMGAAGASNVSIKGSASIDGDLIVKGAVTSIETTNLNVEDQFILLNSGSGATTSDGGIIIRETVAAEGAALFLDSSVSRFAVAKSIPWDQTDDITTVTNPTMEYIVTITSSNGAPPATPEWGGGAVFTSYGNMYVDTNTGDIYIYGG